MSAGGAAGYDCHVETCFRTVPRRLRQFLSDVRPSGAVLVQAADDPAARHNLLESLASFDAVRGVARLAGYEDADALATLDQAGVRGARVDHHFGDPWDYLERITLLHERLPVAWHIELGLPPWAAAQLAPWLAHMGRVFCLSLCSDNRPVSTQEQAKLRWWMDMGNAYLKLVRFHLPKPALAWLELLAGEVPDRVVIGSGWPAANTSPALPELLERVCPAANTNAERLYDFAPLPLQATFH